MKDLKYPVWQKPYQEALMEINPQKLVTRINYAQIRIFLRWNELRTIPDGDEERQAMHDALSALLSLRRDKGIKLFGHKEAYPKKVEGMVSAQAD
jgi:hypothetical protein